MVKRMIPRLSYSGGNEINFPQLKASFESLSGMLDRHFAERPYLLGGRPCFGDFGLWCNLFQAWTDPTAHGFLEANCPNLVAYIKRMQSPMVEGEFEKLSSLKKTLTPILAQEVGARFLPWMEANHQAYAAGEDQTSLLMNGSEFTQKTFKYQAKTLDELRLKYSTVSQTKALKTLMEDTGCQPFLQGG